MGWPLNNRSNGAASLSATPPTGVAHDARAGAESVKRARPHGLAQPPATRHRSRRPFAGPTYSQLATTSGDPSRLLAQLFWREPLAAFQVRTVTSAEGAIDEIQKMGCAGGRTILKELLQPTGRWSERRHDRVAYFSHSIWLTTSGLPMMASFRIRSSSTAQVHVSRAARRGRPES